ncbi:MAG: hypothetical protein SGILL_009481, partial [Bacillariaceae sp.]
MKKWGIPESKRVSNGVTLLERLVWVQYQNHWWPALLYQNYSELQTHLYDQLDMSMKAQFAMAIMKQVQDSKQKFRVARLLGRQMLEVVEVKDGQYAEFYWQLPNVMPQACHRSQYGSDTELYIDFHRSLDQVEQIIEEISESKVNLMPIHDKKTWEQRAKDALESDLSTSAPQARSPKPAAAKIFESKEAAAEVLDETFFGGFDSFMTTLSKGVDGMMGGEEPKTEPTRKSTHEPEPELALKSKYTDARSSIPTEGAVYSGSPLVTSAVRRFSSSSPRGGSVPPVTPQPKSSNHVSIITPPSYEGYRSTSQGWESTGGIMEESRGHSTRAVFEEARDPSNEYYRRRVSASDGNSSKESGSKRSGSKNQHSVELLPGLEADDIVPGITETTMWKNVLEHMLVAKTNGDEEDLKELPKKHQQLQNQHRRMPSGEMQYHDEATVPATEGVPKINSLKILPPLYSGRSAGYQPSPMAMESDLTGPSGRDV